ncbi:histone deacetylase [Sphingomonas sp. ID0503]|uniref:histone deacetylase family protein n=1 Tax=Sphingomonas sp. ID0503 TaxID=3399691 RepID=UPI003AFA9BE5
MLHVVHHPDYVAPVAPDNTYRFDKHAMVMRSLFDSGMVMAVHSPDPMPAAWLEAVHDPAYVAEVAAAAVPPAKERRIGYPVSRFVARRAARVPGGTWLAAKLAIEHGFAANSAGGSHHALYDTGAGYCVFNDLAVATHRLIAEGDAARVLIVDLDVHQGDGTAALMSARDDVFTLSIHAEKNFPVRKAVSTLDIGLEDRVDDAGYMAVLERTLPSVLDAFAPDFVFYQAGVDPHVEDRLGRLALSDAGLAARDRYVVTQVRARGLPIASTMGGGYGADKLAVAQRHGRSIIAMAEANEAY